MCAIIDANVRDQVFGDRRPKAGEFFFNSLNSDKRGIKLVVGGKLLEELSNSKAFNTWLQIALLFGRAQTIPDEKVEAATKELEAQQICSSNDAHVVALARVSGARLLFTNDRELQIDFKNRQIIDGIQGRAYTTLRSAGVTRTHKDLLRRRDLCDTQGSE